MKPRILMNAHGTSPGGGSVPPATTASNPPAADPAPAPTAPPQAQGATFSPDAIKEIATAVRDGIFADLRRAGVLGKQSTKPTAAPSGDGTASAAPVDSIRLRELDRAVTRAGHAARLDGAAYRRLERAFVDEAPDDAEDWVSDYFAGLGLGASAATTTTTATTATTQTQTQPTGHPVSDRGAPPPPQVPLEEADLVRMSDADRNALIRDKGLKWYRETLMKQLKGRPISMRR